MLRRAENVGVAHHAGLFTKKGWATLRVGKASYRVGQGKIHRDDFAQMAQDQQQNPVALIRVNERQYWWFGGHFFWDNDDLGRDQVYALLITRQQRQERQIARAEAIVAGRLRFMVSR